MHVIVLVVIASLSGTITCGCQMGLPPLEDMLSDGGAVPDDGRDEEVSGTVTCAPTEKQEAGPVCVTRERDAASLRFSTAPGTMGTILCMSMDGRLGAVRSDEQTQGSDHHVVVLGLTPWAQYACAYGTVAGEGAGTVLWTTMLTPITAASGPVITELLIDPVGQEPSQEFVEIYNPGPGPVDLGMYRLSDEDPSGAVDPTALGDALPAGTVLRPGALAILVPMSFSLSGPDPSPVEDCEIVRLDSSLGRSGLRNSGGEPVYLIDASGLVVSHYPNTLGTVTQGESVQRIAPTCPAGDAHAWLEGVPTPGWL